jgi:drug/metabolite transporter (DMT)-like permease
VAAPVVGWHGIAAAALIGIAFATNSTLAGMAYAGGSNALSVLAVRAAIAFGALYAWLAIHRVPRRLPRQRRYRALGLGLLFSSYSYGMLAAIERMPVGLAVVTFYIYPLLVGVEAWWSGREPFNALTAAALLLAFGGIVLALDVFGAHPDAFGVMLAIASAVLVTLVLSLNPRVRGDGDSRPVTLHMLGTALCVFALALCIRGHFALPRTSAGWVGFVGAPVFYTVAIIALFDVLGRIGPLRMSLVLNVEPVAAVVLGYLLLGQRLSTLQVCGVALVVGAVLLVEGYRSRRR